MEHIWPFPRQRKAAVECFFLHLDETASVRLRHESDRTYSIIVNERLGSSEVIRWSNAFSTLFDACLYLGVVLGVHAGEYQAAHGELPPSLLDLGRRLTSHQPAHNEDTV